MQTLVSIEHDRAGGCAARAVIFPCIPAFYNRPQDSTEMARQFVYRVLAHIELRQPGAYVWKGEE